MSQILVCQQSAVSGYIHLTGHQMLPCVLHRKTHRKDVQVSTGSMATTLLTEEFQDSVIDQMGVQSCKLAVQLRHRGEPAGYAADCGRAEYMPSAPPGGVWLANMGKNPPYTLRLWR